MGQPFDSVETIQAGKKVDDLVIGNLVVLLAVGAEPVKRSAKLAVVKAYKPAVIHALECCFRCRRKVLRFWVESWAFSFNPAPFGRELRANLIVLDENAPVIGLREG